MGFVIHVRERQAEMTVEGTNRQHGHRENTVTLKTASLKLLTDGMLHANGKKYAGM
jgi:hypothetical protein